MVRRALSLAIACLFSLTVEAQLPSGHVSPVNYFGRYHGFGYSDGYHACQDGKCKTSNTLSARKQWEPMASFYAKPTSPPTSRLGQAQGISISPAYFPHLNRGDSENFSPSQNYTQNYLPVPATAEPSPQMRLPESSQFSPRQFAPSQADLPNSDLYESVPPAPRKANSSPSDRESFELPTPADDRERHSNSSSPSAQIRRVTPGSFSHNRSSLLSR